MASPFVLCLILSFHFSPALSQMAPLRHLLQEIDHRMGLLAPILTNLGFQELAMAIPTVYSPVLTSWSGPITVFAPSDESIRSCISCSASLLREHIVPGLYSRIYLSNLAYGTKLETVSPGRCLTITSTNLIARSNSTLESTDLDWDPSPIKISIDGVEITRFDLFNDGQIIIHGIQGIVPSLSFASCAQNSLPSFSPEHNDTFNDTSIMRQMLRDSILRLFYSGYNIIALAMRVKFAELAGLNNMTVFALDDHAIFTGGHEYITQVRFHIVPNKILTISDLMSLRQGALLPTLVHGQHLVVTRTGAGPPVGSMRINFAPIKRLNVVYNTKIVVHSIFFPFRHLFLADLASAAIFGSSEGDILEVSSKIGSTNAAGTETCKNFNGVGAGECRPSSVTSPMSSAVVDLDEGF